MKKLRCKRQRELSKVTGKWMKDCYTWLKEEDCGCCHLIFDTSELHNICVVVGWSQLDADVWSIAWEIGQESFANGMQTDMDLDFEMPWNTEAYCAKMNATLTEEDKKRGNKWYVGDVYDTRETIDLKEGKSTPVGYRDWNDLASYVRKTARKVARFIKEVDALEAKQ